MSQTRELPRYVPERVFPPYAFVPGRAPHPVSDPRGHSYGVRREVSPPVTADTWRDNADYLWGADLYNHGYPWEAHEAWEGLWRQADRGSVVHAHLQGLIQCAAAVVKVMAEHPAGVASLSTSGVGRLEDVIAQVGPVHLGVDLAVFSRAFAAYAHRWAEAWAAGEPADAGDWPVLVVAVG